MNDVDTDEGHKRFRVKMRQMENYVIKLSDEEFAHLLTVVESEIEERERQKQ